MTTYLSKQKKVDLQALATRAGIATDTLLKEEIVAKLDEHLKANIDKHSSDKIFAEYYERSGSPVKKSRPEGEKVQRRKTVTTKPEPSSPEASSSSLIQNSPAIQAVVRRLPSSPSLSRAVNVPTTWAKRQYSTAVKKSGVKKNLPILRSEWSRLETIQLLTLIFEAVGLREQTFPFHWQVLPGYKPARIPQTGSWLPDFTLLATKGFWAPTSLWALTSFLLPVVTAYLFNLTYQNPRLKNKKHVPLKEIDPLVFSITKALLAYAVFSPYSSFTFWGAFDADSVNVVSTGIYGGYNTLLIGSAIGVITSIYELLSYKS